uniref:Uncharacterized protein n=2 Tax=Planktothrix pseudagardhii TaxID=132604 RepID=A0A9W4G3R3_9CYAN|nr:hypothetical protein NO713_00811 [Planktothrix pseudagardhii]
MSVADSGPYKSRLFNFISQTAQKLTDEGSRTWRYFKYATEMTLQTALYPVYFLLQTVRVTRQKLATAVKQHFPQLASQVKAETSEPPDVDTPIIQVLNTVATQTESLFQNSITSAPVALDLQGIASQVDSQTLVLVQKDNVILDSLTVEEQHHLQQQIVLEIANYYYFYQHLAQQQKPFQPQLKPALHSPHILAPIRWFWQVMSWVQTSSVAVKINCFGEANFAESSSFPYLSPQLIYTLDGAIAQVEDYSIVPLSHATHNIVQQSQTWGQTVIQVWQKPPQTDVAVKSESSLEQGFDEYFYKIQSLILAAIDYFFGEHHPPLTSEENPEQFSGVISTPNSSPASPLPQTPLEDPGLTPEILAENILSKLKKPKPAKFRPASFSPNPLTNKNNSTQNRVWEKVQSSLNRFNPSPTPEEHLSLTSPVASKPLTKSQNHAIEFPNISNSATPEAKPDWLEAQVTSTGYIKHPLERILGWLDQIMVKVEETIAKAWYWLTHYQKN